jgi:flagellar basal body-associated protein FliL
MAAIGDGGGKPGFTETLSRAFGLIVLLLLVAVAAGTVFALATGTRARKLAALADAKAAPPGSYVYSRIGTLRAKTLDKPPAVVVATVSFPYPVGEAAFAEELDTKTESLKAAVLACLSAKKAAELAPAYEGAFKAELKDRLNALLSLGQITEIWLSDFAVIQ